MRILIVSDAWTPQINGVVRTLCATRDALAARGHEVSMITPDRFTSIPCPTYPEIRLALTTHGKVARMIATFAPDAIHIATEGPLGLAARRWCLRNRQRFTTAYHTQFPAYVAARTGLSPALLWRYIRWFHRGADQVLTATGSIRDELRTHGINHLAHWGRGVDASLFLPDHAPHPGMAHLPRPIMLYVGRVAVEKNIGAFLDTAHMGSKVVVGDGPALSSLRATYPDTYFLGPLSGDALASAYCAADVLVFPSRTDTFGLVMIEALACGTPVAAYPVTGPRDIITPASGALDDDLGDAIGKALLCDRGAVADEGAQHNWERATDQFLSALVPSNCPPAQMAGRYHQQNIWETLPCET
ncbi:MAG: glycosyltransferase family 1 protein [Sphingopyxis sp.]